MAALDGKIEIGIEYRPCMIKIPAKIKYQRNTSTAPRNYVVESPEHEIKGLFHCWTHRSEVVGESALRGGHSAGQISATFAIVEYEDGTVHEVEPWNIRFVDGLVNQYGFREELNAE